MSELACISSTQISTFIDCIRKWFFITVLKLPEIKSYHLAFGQVFHALIARYLQSDETGRGIELFPKGWLETDDGIVTEEDGELIKKLLEAGIESGILAKYKGRLVEYKFDRKLTDTTRLIGYIDLLLLRERTVVDHKTIKDFRYALSSNALKTDMQMLIYAAELAIQWMEIYKEELPSVILRHNQFQKDPNDIKVKFTEAEVTIEEIDTNWERCKEIAHRMDMWRLTAKEEWEKVPGPENFNICNKYGGCPFLKICGKTETIDFYRKRINRALENFKHFSGEKAMGLFDQLKNKKKDAEPKTEISEDQSEDQNVFESPPWANPECPACSGAGLNTKGNPCRICDQVAKAKGNPDSSHYLFVEELEGWIISSDSTKQQEDKKESLDTVDPNKIKNTGLRKALLEKQGKSNVEKSEEESNKPEKEHSEESKTARKEKAKKGRPPAGITLCINCAYTSFGSREIISMDSIFQELKEKVSEAMGGNFYQLDQWKRKDALAVAVSHHIDSLGTAIVIASPGGSGMDYKACLEALRGYAQTIIEGLS